MLRWMLMFVLVLGLITGFVLFVLGVPIPGLSWLGIQQPSSPFSP